MSLPDLWRTRAPVGIEQGIDLSPCNAALGLSLVLLSVQRGCHITYHSIHIWAVTHVHHNLHEWMQLDGVTNAALMPVLTALVCHRKHHQETSPIAPKEKRHI